MASKNVKTILLLNGDNVNISPATDVTSIYYDYEENDIWKRKYVYDQWPVKLNMSLDQATYVTATTTTGLLNIDNGQTIKAGSGTDILVSYVYQSILPGTNIYQLNTSIYNLSNILYNYASKYIVNTSINALKEDVETYFDDEIKDYQLQIVDLSTNFDTIMSTTIADLSTKVDETSSRVSELASNYNTLKSTTDAIANKVSEFKTAIEKIQDYTTNIINIDEATLIRYMQEASLIPGCIYRVTLSRNSYYNRCVNISVSSSFEVLIKAISVSSFDHRVLYVGHNIANMQLEYDTIYNKFYATYMEDYNGNKANFDFINADNCTINGTNNTIMLKANALLSIISGFTITGSNNDLYIDTDYLSVNILGNNNILNNATINGALTTNNSLIKDSYVSAGTYNACNILNSSIVSAGTITNSQFINASVNITSASCSYVYVENSTQVIISATSNIGIMNYDQPINASVYNSYYTSNDMLAQSFSTI